MRFRLYVFKSSGCFGMVTTATVNLIQDIFYWQYLWTHWSGITLLHHPLSFDLGSHYLKKPRRSCVKVQKNPKIGPKILLFDLRWPPDMPLGQNFCTTVFCSSLPLIWYATWLCTKWILDPSGPHPSGPAPRGYIKILNVFLHSLSIGLSPVKVLRF